MGDKAIGGDRHHPAPLGDHAAVAIGAITVGCDLQGELEHPKFPGGGGVEMALDGRFALAH